MATYYSLEDIAKNNGKNGNRTWIIIKGSVYDATDVLEQHAGGPEAILEWAGKDATQAFNDVGHSSTAIGYLKGIKIGEADVVSKKSDRSFVSYVTCGICG